MPRRFLTVEDLERLDSREIEIDDETLVTPQALEAARAAGITISSPSGLYTEPRPDRGPDAHRAQASIPLMPEPEAAEDGGVGLVVTVVGRNRPGVLAEVTALFAAEGISIHDISQKMVAGFFHVVLTLELPPGGTFASVKQAAECLGGPEDYVVQVMHERVFRYMHRI